MVNLTPFYERIYIFIKLICDTELWLSFKLWRDTVNLLQV